jgi:hypothetical protein
MWLDRLLMLTEIAILVWMLRLDHLNHSLYREFFSERTRWYAARRKKTPGSPGSDAAHEMLIEAIQSEQNPDAAPSPLDQGEDS